MLEKWLGWLKESNRPAHMKAGALVYVVMLVVCLLLGVSVSSSMILAFVATAIVAVAVDYKDKLWGGKFDWLDVAATVIIPGVTTLLGMLVV